MRKNPFNNKLQARDRAVFQPYHQNLTVNDLINITLTYAAKGSSVIEGVIKVGNNLFMPSDNFNKTEAIKNNNWIPALRIYAEYCLNTLPPRDIEAELIDTEELFMEDIIPGVGQIDDEIEEGDGEKDKKKEIKLSQQDWSFNPYEAKELYFFLEIFKERLPYLFPLQDLNRKFLLSMSPNFIIQLFQTEAKSVDDSLTLEHHDQSAKQVD